MTLTKHIKPDLRPQRLDRQWRAIAAADGARSPRRFLWLAPVAIAAAAALVLWLRPSAAPIPAVPRLVSGPTAQPLSLPDGSRVTTHATTRLEIVEARREAVALDLRDGRVDLDVVPSRDRPFVVRLPGAEVAVLGTRFSVELDSARGAYAVRVTRGRVAIRGARIPGGERTVVAGESFHGMTGPSTATPVVTPLPAPAPVAIEQKPVPRRAARTERAAVERAPAERPAPAVNPADEAFDAATALRASGDARAAASAFAAFCARYPRDARAGLAAFELGRIRLDRLSDPAGAHAALTLARRFPFDPALREDLDARVVEALDRMGDRTRCIAARDQYLAAHPRGPHAAAVRERCRR